MLFVSHLTPADALTVPRSALLEDAGETAVFAVREAKAVRVPIEVGHMSGELVEVRKGLTEGEQVSLQHYVAER